MNMESQHETCCFTSQCSGGPLLSVGVPPYAAVQGHSTSGLCSLETCVAMETALRCRSYEAHAGMLTSCWENRGVRYGFQFLLKCLKLPFLFPEAQLLTSPLSLNSRLSPLSFPLTPLISVCEPPFAASFYLFAPLQLTCGHFPPKKSY